MFMLMIHSIYAVIVIGNLIQTLIPTDQAPKKLKIACDCYLIIVILLHSPIVYLQL